MKKTNATAQNKGGKAAPKKAIGTVKATLKLTGTASLKKPVTPPTPVRPANPVNPTVRPAAPAPVRPPQPAPAPAPAPVRPPVPVVTPPPVRPVVHPAAPTAAAPQPRRQAAATPARARRVPQTPPPITPPAPPIQPPNAFRQFCRRNWMSLAGLTMLALALMLLLLLLLKHNGGNSGSVSMFTGTNVVPAGFSVTISPTMNQTVNGEGYGKRSVATATPAKAGPPEGWLTDEEFNSSVQQDALPAASVITALESGNRIACEWHTVPPHTRYTYPLIGGSKYFVVPSGNRDGVLLYYNRTPLKMVPASGMNGTLTSYTFDNTTDYPAEIGFQSSLLKH